MQYLGIPHHEYWSWWWFSFPIWPQWIWYAIRLRKATWFTAVNPSIEHSGYTEESKSKINAMLPSSLLPKTIVINHVDELPETLLPFPCIAKPDIGGRGRKIKIIHSFQELQDYHQEVGEDYMVQEIIDYPLELGIFYTKRPSDNSGKIISVTEKGFLSVCGDGHKTIRTLLAEHKRASAQLPRLETIINLNRILALGEEYIVEPIGNHCRGTVFINRKDCITPELQQVFDDIVAQVPGFHYGRFDLRVKSWDDLYAGKHIYILELNGLTSMDTHVFDPQFRLRDVLPVLVKNCRICFEIARENIQQGAPTTPLPLLIKKSMAFFKE